MQTPGWALQPLFPYLPKTSVIWECAAGKGNLVDRLLKEGYKVKWSDIIRDPLENFFTWQPKAGWDIIVTNPPYDEKDKWIRHCYELQKPWAMLLPITALGGKRRQLMYNEYGLQVIFFDKRVNFEVPSGKNSPWFATAWFTHGLNLPRDMVFHGITKDG
jgi:hypothetical protein